MEFKKVFRNKIAIAGLTLVMAGGFAVTPTQNAKAATGYNTYTVKSGDTLGALAQRFGVPLQTLISVNRIKNVRALKAGQKLMVPGKSGSRTNQSSRSISAGSGRQVFPAAGVQSSPFGWRNGRMHKGIDIAGPIGTPIRSMRDGVVTFAGWSGAYGNLVRIQHSNGLVTQYAHASRIFVRSGQRVSAGQNIAAIGNTGRSTGPHLHFETLVNGVAVNPRNYL